MTASYHRVIPGFVGICLLLGGASAAGYLANALLQMLAIGLLFVAWIGGSSQETSKAERALVLLILAMIGVVLVQLLPLPIAWWRGLPGRAVIDETLQLTGIARQSGFVSLIPHESLKSAIWLLPPLAVALGMMRARNLFSGTQLAIAIVAATCVGVLFEALQLMGGVQSPFYLYDFTNRGLAVGLFANANHMASLLLVAIPFEAALLRHALGLDRRRRAAAVVGVLAALAITLAGIAANGSLAGYGLSVPVLLGSALIVRPGERMLRTAALLLIPAVLGAAALIYFSAEGQDLLNRGSSMGTRDREMLFATSFQAIRDYWPVGTGLGTFAEVYPSYEDPLTISASYANHAHNDYIELVFETGALGAAAMLGFLGWWVVAAVRVWRDALAPPYARAAVVATAALLVHSLVDYPLRTAGLAAVFAACCALLAASPPGRNRVSLTVV